MLPQSDPFGDRWMHSVYRLDHAKYYQGEVVSVRILECRQNVVFLAVGRRSQRQFRSERMDKCFWDLMDLPVRSECIMSFLDRAVPGEDGALARRVVEDGEFERRFPAIFEYITRFAWPDKTPRVTSTITLFLDGDLFKLFLNDREHCRSTFMTSDTILSVAELLEEVLADGKAPWRANREEKQATRRK